MIEVYAHEAYVLTPEQFQEGLKVVSPNPLAPLFDPQYLTTSIVITFAIGLVFALNFLFARTKIAKNFDKHLKKLSEIGLLAVRLAIAASFLVGALESSIFGPEITLVDVPGGQVILFAKIVVGLLLAFGFFTRLAAILGLVIYAYLLLHFGPYLLTYLNYFGELLALALFGSKLLTVDSLLFKSKINRLSDWGVPIVRIFYGLALIYAAVSIKFLHQGVPIEVVNIYHLDKYFHSSANFIAAGAGLSELAIGLFIVLGFAQRLTVLISLIFITLSLLFFREDVWPHLMLYGIGIMIFINASDKLTIDRYVPKILKYLKLAS